MTTGAGVGRERPGPDTAEVRTEIERRLAAHTEALAAADIDRCLELYTEDAVVRPANMEPVRGEADLRAFFEAWFDAMAVRDVEYATEELDVHEDRAYHIGAYVGSYVPHGGAPVPDRGSFHIVWQRVSDGSWRYHRGIFNSSLPAETTITSKGE